MRIVRSIVIASFVLGAAIAGPTTAARAELVLSQLVVELTPGDHGRSDIEIWNDDRERAYVAAEPRLVVNPGTPSESRRDNPDPEKLGLLVSPSRMILEPGQRRLLRIAAIAPPSDREQVYRVTVRPVVGELSAAGSGLKVLVGYDVLVLVRPKEMHAHVSGSRQGGKLILKNDGNVSVELVDGKRCDSAGSGCSDLPGARLYAGAEKVFDVKAGGQVQYKLKVGPRLIPVKF
jgi:P pilus assembly chaperone PapD